MSKWVRMVAVGHSQRISYDDTNALLVLGQIPEPQATVRSLAANLQIPLAERQALEALTQIAGFNELRGAASPQDPGVAISSLQIIAALIIVALGAVILTIVGRAALAVNGGAPESSQAAPASDAPAPAAQHPAAQTFSPYANPPVAAPQPSGSMHPQYGAPVLHTMSQLCQGQQL